jgi:RimJ/RimL family protein N-acetyltransferase
MPFGVAWTDRLDRDDFAAFHTSALESWAPERWDCNFVTFLRDGGRAVGTQALHGRDFGATREVGTGSWLGAAHQGHGLGTEQRAAVLELAFRGLGARAATSGALAHNRASQRVSEKLGYRFTHEDTLSPRGEPVRQLNYRIERSGWRCPIPVEIDGLAPCLPLFGAA